MVILMCVSDNECSTDNPKICGSLQESILIPEQNLQDNEQYELT